MAFGSAISDVVHVYERGIGKGWKQARAGLLGDAAGALYRQAVRDLEGEGFDPGKAVYRYSLDVAGADDRQETLSFESAGVPGGAWLQQAEAAAANLGAGDTVQILTLRAEYGVDRLELSASTKTGGKARATERAICFSAECHGPTPTTQWEAMGVGDRVSGPAVINGQTLTCAIPPGWSSHIDKYGNAQLKQNRSDRG